MTCSRSHISRTLLPLLALLALLSPASLQATQVGPIETTFKFDGSCTDCEGPATATLVLQDYTQGQTIVASNLVSFTYDGTNLLPGFIIYPADLLLNGNIGGMIPAVLPAFANFSISGGAPWHLFGSSNEGVWSASVSQTPPDDYGTAGTWGDPPASGVPEPAAFLLVAVGMALIAVRRWKVRR